MFGMRLGLIIVLFFAMTIIPLTIADAYVNATWYAQKFWKICSKFLSKSFVVFLEMELKIRHSKSSCIRFEYSWDFNNFKSNSKTINFKTVKNPTTFQRNWI